jgi:hypothetical protein
VDADICPGATLGPCLEEEDSDNLSGEEERAAVGKDLGGDGMEDCCDVGEELGDDIDADLGRIRDGDLGVVDDEGLGDNDEEPGGDRSACERNDEGVEDDGDGGWKGACEDGAGRCDLSTESTQRNRMAWPRPAHKKVRPHGPPPCNSSAFPSPDPTRDVTIAGSKPADGPGSSAFLRKSTRIVGGDMRQGGHGPPQVPARAHL